jgi:hypothetical protein
MGDEGRICSQGAGYKSEESTRNRAHRMRCLPLKATHWSHAHKGGEVAHKPTLKIKETRV